MLITDCLPRFENHLKVILGLSAGTIDQYRRHLVRFQGWLQSRGVQGGNDLQEISQTDIEDWMKHLFLHGGNLQNSARAVKLAAIKKFFAFMVYDKAIDAGQDPAVNIPMPKIARKMPQKFSTQQLQDILAAPDLGKPQGIRDKAILMVLYGLGPRVDEIRNIDIDNLRFSGKDIYIYIKGKGAKERTVRLMSRPSEALRCWLAIREKYVALGELAVFISFRPPKIGTRMSPVSYNKILKKYAAAVGITDERVFVHKVRSTFATDLYDMGHGIKEISIILGHTSIETTNGYISISEKALKKTSIPNTRWKELEGRADDEGR